MRSPVSQYTLVRPKSLGHALASMSASVAAGARLVPLAGGTDLYVTLNAGAPAGTQWLDLQPLRELRGIRVGTAGATFGGLVTFREIRDHARVAKQLPSLVAAAREVGAWQIQNRATIAGNVANASPAGDSLPVLLAHDAVVVARSVRGAREVPFDGLYTGYRTLALAPDELIVAVRVPFAPARAAQFFRKVGTRRAQSISKVVFCGVLRRARDGRVDHVRLAFGSVAPVTLRARAAEAALLGAAPSAAAATAAAAALTSDLAPIDDIRSSKEYRVAIAANVLAQFLRTVDPRYAG